MTQFGLRWANAIFLEYLPCDYYTLKRDKVRLAGLLEKRRQKIIQSDKFIQRDVLWSWQEWNWGRRLPVLLWAHSHPALSPLGIQLSRPGQWLSAVKADSGCSADSLLKWGDALVMVPSSIALPCFIFWWKDVTTWNHEQNPGFPKPHWAANLWPQGFICLVVQWSLL